jgi:chemotaxis protein methyltransferase CheR
VPSQLKALASPPLGDAEFGKVRELLLRHAGISLGPSKKPLVSSRLTRRLAPAGCAGFTEYLQLLASPQGAQELQLAVDLLTTNETHFFREPRHFDFLRAQLPALVRPGRPLRVWSAACSSGEEVFSLAMVLDEVLPGQAWEVHGSDISARMLERARSGLYPISRMHEIPQPYLRRHCLRGTGAQADKLLIERRLRERVRFSRHNLLDAAPANGDYDVILLRNVMIYFDAATKREVVARLLPQLRGGGYFLVSHSETLNGVSDALRLVQPAVYRKPLQGEA